MGARVMGLSAVGFPGGFTVLMAVYRGDDAPLFERAVRSVFDNTLRPDAFVLVADGPVLPALATIITKLETEFALNVLRLPENRGLALALNAGLQVVTTEWVVRADADDINLPHRFDRLAQALTGTPAPDLLGSAILELERDGSKVAVRRTPMTHGAILHYAKYRNPFNHMTVAYRRRLALDCGGYPQVHLKEDYALWASMIRKGAVTHNLNDVLVHATAGRDMYRRRGGLRYARAEIELQSHLVVCRLKSPLLGILHGLMRATVFLLPTGFRDWVYTRFLRHPVM